MPDWILWVGGLSVALGCGFLATAIPRRRERVTRLDEEQARARRAISLAEATRDSAAHDDPQADQLLAEAEALLSGNRDPQTAVRARQLAERAERHWLADTDRP